MCARSAIDPGRADAGGAFMSWANAQAWEEGRGCVVGWDGMMKGLADERKIRNRW